MPTPAELVDRYAAALLARETDASDANNHTIQVTQDALCAAAERGTPEAKNELVRELTRHLRPEHPIRTFGILANTAGMIVEWGADPGLALPAILDRLPAMFAAVPEMVDQLQSHFGTTNLDSVPPETWRPITDRSEEAKLAGRMFFALRFTGCAAMTMLVRRPELRIAARTRADLLTSAESARDDNPYAYYISEVLGTVDGEEIVVIDLARNLGFRVLLTAVRNNFHLFTLLQGELLNHPTAADWTGPRSHPLAVQLARTERLADSIPEAEWKAFAGPSGHGYDSAIWTFYQWPALRATGSLETQAQVPRGQMPWWVWGEAKPTEIAQLDGTRVVLLGALELPRSWGVNFFMPLHGDLRSSTAVTAALSAEEVRSWLERIRKAKR